MLSLLLFTFSAVGVVESIGSFRMPIEPVDLVNRNWSAVQGDGYGIRLNNFGDVEVIVGTPPKEFRVVFDTGSTKFWVMSHKCRVETSRGNACKGKTLYNGKKSTTYKRVSGKFSQLYEIGFAYGGMAKDTVAMGTLKEHSLLTENVVFGTATVIDAASQDDVIDGVMGLGFPKPGEPESLINRAVASGTLDKPVYTVWMKKVGGDVDKLGGEITFGDIDKDRCERTVGYVNLTTTNYWQFNTDKVTAQRDGKEIEIASKIEALSDTGTSAVVVPKDVYKRIIKLLGITSNAPGLPYISCKAKFTLNIYINGVNYPLTAQDLMVRYSDGCVLQLDISLIDGDDTWILGNPFTRTYCQIYDLGQKRIGFARAVFKKASVPKCKGKCLKSGAGRRWQKNHQNDGEHPLVNSGSDDTQDDDYNSEEVFGQLGVPSIPQTNATNLSQSFPTVV